MDNTLSDQVSQTVSENQHLRVRCENQEITIDLMKSQYSALSASVNGIRDKLQREITSLTAERDRAVIAYREIHGLLMQSANITMQALNARIGNETPEHIPDRQMGHITDDRLPRLGI